MQKTRLSLIAAAAMMATLPALAQQTPPPVAATPAAAKVAIPANVFFKGQTANQYFATDKLLGLNVLNKEGTVIGPVTDLILNGDNQVEGVIIGVGGVAGIGGKNVGVRYSALQIVNKDGKTSLSLPQATKEVLAAIEPYKRAEPKRSLVDRAKDKAKELTDKTKDATGPALEKAKEAGKAAIEKGKALIETQKAPATKP